MTLASKFHGEVEFMSLTSPLAHFLALPAMNGPLHAELKFWENAAIMSPGCESPALQLVLNRIRFIMTVWTLRWPVPIYMRVGYVFDSRFSE